ncbi:E3 ubiquitin-protein ligase RGLG2-like protein [Carex littledalei]|uniref:E3 ubiquitin-protein ligase RGLG2-like protein n=1 Tax=Carex littledalei TaxID=544730 RepID=A0A833QWE7_9POAL|nr:E3 ubiquitin-protein ligase RGLG2-like protein [Carex littledalei]
MANFLWVVITKIWGFLLFLILVILEMISRIIKKISGKTSSEESSSQSSQRSVPQTSQVPSHHRDHRHLYDHHHWGPSYSRDFSSYDEYSGFRRRNEYDYDSDSPPRGGYPHPYSRNEGYPSRNFPPRGYPSYRDDYSRREYRREVQTQPSSYQMPAVPVPVQNVTARPPPMQPAASQPSGSKPRLDRKYSKIVDEFRSLEEVTEALAKAGLESSNLIIGIDFTKSNEWTGPTSFAPIIEMAMTIVEQSGGQYHVLVIIADGQVTRSVDTQHGQLSPQEQKTVESIVLASQFPLSILLVGVGDGPWDMMREFDDNIPARSFDNFQFVNFTEIMSKNVSQTRKETEFALASLMEVPLQYKATLELGILGRVSSKSPGRVPLPPPPGSYNVASFQSHYRDPGGHKLPEPSPMEIESTAPPPGASSEAQCCPICLTNPKDMAFGCGHQTCRDCGPNLDNCPICRRPINTRIRLY